MHTQTRQELYGILCQLCRLDVNNYSTIVERLEDLIPLGLYSCLYSCVFPALACIIAD